MRRAFLSLPVLALALTACATTTSSEPACCGSPGPASVSGSLVGVGGPAGAGPAHWSGTISVSGRGRTTVATDAHGHFHVTLRPGLYRITGTSPSFQGGRATCTVQAPVRVRPHRTTFVRVACPLR